MTETEKYVKAESRSVTKTEQEYEPEFSPFSFGEDKEDTAFEVEQQYTAQTLKTDAPAMMELPTFKTSEEENVEIVANKQAQARPHLNAHGKIVASVFAVIVAIMIAFCIYNAVSINNLENVVAYKQQIVAEQNEVISNLEAEYNSLGEDISERLDDLDTKFREPNADDIKRVKKFEMSEREKQEEPSNWFERFCEKLRNLF